MFVSSKLQLKLTTFTFGIKTVQKGYFWSKPEKVNTTIEFCTFEPI